MKKPQDYSFCGLIHIQIVTFLSILLTIIISCSLITLILNNPVEKATSNESTSEKDYAIPVISVLGTIIFFSFVAMFGILRKNTTAVYPFLLIKFLQVGTFIFYSTMLVLDEQYVTDVGPNIYPLNWVTNKVTEFKKDISSFAVMFSVNQFVILIFELYVTYVVYRCIKRLRASTTLKITPVA